MKNKQFQSKFKYFFSFKLKKTISKNYFFFTRLFDNENVTCDENHMWLCPFNRKDKVRIIITLSVSKRLHGLRIWNYNKSPDETYRGVCFIK